MKKGQNYYKRMAADCILEKLSMGNLVSLYNRMGEENNYPIRIFDNSTCGLNTALDGHNFYSVLVAATNGRWVEGDDYAYINESSRGTELHSFSRLTDNDCPIYLSELEDWLEREDFLPLEDIYTKDDYQYEVENCFRMFAEEDEGFSPVGIGIFIGEQGGIALEDNWDNYIIDMYSK